MNQFSSPRFLRLIQNDVLRVARPVIFGTLALLGLTVLIYLANFETGRTSDPPLYNVLFSIYLLGGGLVFTSLAFQDMHHPLERYQYLMLPCTNVERFLSRYLLTGPLLLIYIVVAFSAMDWIANLLSGAGEEVKFDRGEMKFKVAIPDQVRWKVELELSDDESELEIELKW